MSGEEKHAGEFELACASPICFSMALQLGNGAYRHVLYVRYWWLVNRLTIYGYTFIYMHVIIKMLTINELWLYI